MTYMSLVLKQQNHSCSLTQGLSSLAFQTGQWPFSGNPEAELKPGQILAFNKNQLQDFPLHMEFSCEFPS